MNPLYLYGAFVLGWLLLAWVSFIAPLQAVLLIVGGFMIWTLAEYVVHRWFIHGQWRPGKVADTQLHSPLSSLRHVTPPRSAPA